MDRAQFDECIAMLRSSDAMTYEDGYHGLQDHLGEYLEDLITLTLKENDPKMRERFVELLGDSKDPLVIPHLQRELAHPARRVREWAYSGLRNLGHARAEEIAAAYARDNPQEDFVQ
jgi:HEAT repeat protein